MAEAEKVEQFIQKKRHDRIFTVIDEQDPVTLPGKFIRLIIDEYPFAVNTQNKFFILELIESVTDRKVAHTIKLGKLTHRHELRAIRQFAIENFAFYQLSDICGFRHILFHINPV